jgi:acetyltransferase-like isoleucine patch superfamily enzyme
MEQENIFQGRSDLQDLFQKIKEINYLLSDQHYSKYKRLVSLPDLYSDRWERAKKYGFGENTNVYDNSLIIGDVKIGKECWIGPNTIIDGSGGLKIGNYCTISAGVQIYSHDSVNSTLSSKKAPIDRDSVSIGNNVYISPNVLITKGVSIGNNVVIGAFSLVNKDIDDNSIVFGQPIRLIKKIK